MVRSPGQLPAQPLAAQPRVQTARYCHSSLSHLLTLHCRGKAGGAGPDEPGLSICQQEAAQVYPRENVQISLRDREDQQLVEEGVSGLGLSSRILITEVFTIAGRVLASAVCRQRPAGDIPHQPGIHRPGDRPVRERPDDPAGRRQIRLQNCPSPHTDLDVRLALSAGHIVYHEEGCT